MYQETAFIGVVCVSLAWVLYLCARYATSKLPPAPGPFLARFTRLWYLKAVVKGDFERVNIDLHRKYGELANTPLFVPSSHQTGQAKSCG